MRRWPVSVARWGRCTQGTAGPALGLPGCLLSPVWQHWLLPLSWSSLCTSVGHDRKRLLYRRTIDQCRESQRPASETVNMSILSVYHHETPEQPFKVLTHHDDVAATLAEVGVHLERWQAGTAIAANADDG